jgi:hypothetical protein
MTDARTTSTPPATYQHTQTGPWHFVLFSIGTLQLIVAVALREQPYLGLLFLSCSILMCLLAFSCRSLTIEDRGEHLVVRFGPLPFLQQKIAYKDIVSATVSHTTMLDGFGIHYSLRGGWVWNIWGFPCVHVKLTKSQLWLGSDEPEKLAAWISSRLEG